MYFLISAYERSPLLTGAVYAIATAVGQYTGHTPDDSGSVTLETRISLAWTGLLTTLMTLAVPHLTQFTMRLLYPTADDSDPEPEQ